MILLVLLYFIIYGTFKIPMNKKMIIHTVFLIYLILQFIFINLSYFIYFYSYCIIINGQIIRGNIK